MDKTLFKLLIYVFISIFFITYNVLKCHKKIKIYAENGHIDKPKIDIFCLFPRRFNDIFTYMAIIVVALFFLGQFFSEIYIASLFFFPSYFLTATYLHLNLYFKLLNKQLYHQFIDNSTHSKELFSRFLVAKEKIIFEDSKKIIAVSSFIFGAIVTSGLDYFSKTYKNLAFIRESYIPRIVILAGLLVITTIIILFILLYLWSVLLSIYLKVNAYFTYPTFEKLNSKKTK